MPAAKLDGSGFHTPLRKAKRELRLIVISGQVAAAESTADAFDRHWTAF